MALVERADSLHLAGYDVIAMAAGQNPDTNSPYLYSIGRDGVIIAYNLASGAIEFEDVVASPDECVEAPAVVLPWPPPTQPGTPPTHSHRSSMALALFGCRQLRTTAVPVLMLRVARGGRHTPSFREYEALTSQPTLVFKALTADDSDYVSPRHSAHRHLDDDDEGIFVNAVSASQRVRGTVLEAGTRIKSGAPLLPVAATHTAAQPSDAQSVASSAVVHGAAANLGPEPKVARRVPQRLAADMDVGAVAVSPCGRLCVMALGSTIRVLNSVRPQGGVLAAIDLGVEVTSVAVGTTTFVPEHDVDEIPAHMSPRPRQAGDGAGTGEGDDADAGEGHSPDTARSDDGAGDDAATPMAKKAGIDIANAGVHLIPIDTPWRQRAEPGEIAMLIAGTCTGSVAIVRLMDVRVMAAQRRTELYEKRQAENQLKMLKDSGGVAMAPKAAGGAGKGVGAGAGALSTAASFAGFGGEISNMPDIAEELMNQVDWDDDDDDDDDDDSDTDA